MSPRPRRELACIADHSILRVGANSGVETRRELPAGLDSFSDQGWTRRSITADTAADAILVKVKADGEGRASVANFAGH